MMPNDFFRRHELLGFFLLVMTLSWGIYAVLSVPGGLGLVARDNPASGILSFCKQFSPSIAGLIVAYVAGGRAGARRMRRAALDWRAAPKWYALVLLAFPLFLVGAGAVVSVIQGTPALSPDVTPGYLVATVVFIGIVGPAGEELFGWRGFALPGLLERVGDFQASVLLGIVWALWHAPVWSWPLQKGGVPAQLAAVCFVVAISIVMTWVYRKSGSLLLAGLGVHAASNAAHILPHDSTVWVGHWATTFLALVIVATQGLGPWTQTGRSPAAT